MLRLSNRIKPVADEIGATELGYPTMFEICVTMAILYFAEVTYPYFVVWETDSGGDWTHEYRQSSRLGHHEHRNGPYGYAR